MDILKQKNSFLLSVDVERYVRFVKFENGILYINLESGYPKEIIRNLNSFFETNKYKIKALFSDEKGEDTLAQKKQRIFAKQLEEVAKNPIFKEVMECFRNSVVDKIEDL